MTYQEIKDIVVARYMREIQKAGAKEQLLDKGEFKVFADMVLDEIYRELSILDPSTTINVTPVTVFTEYSLPADFGGLRGISFVKSDGTTIGGFQITEIGQLPVTGTLTQGNPNKLAIYAKSDGLYHLYMYPLSGYAGTLSVRYKAVFPINAGQTSGAILTGSIPLPSAYYRLLIEGILAMLLPDRINYYYQLLQKAREDRPVPTKGFIEYSFGGLDDEDIDNGFSKNFNGE